MKLKRYTKLTALGLFFLLANGQIFGAQLKRVLVLDFINADKLSQYSYLESSITDAVRKSLSAKFAYSETRRHNWEAIAEDNFLYKEDLHTKSAAMNLGLLSKQDVVIAGNFNVVSSVENGKPVDVKYTFPMKFEVY